MWSPVEKTALAEAEIEYEDIVSTRSMSRSRSSRARSRTRRRACGDLDHHAWTIPVNQAIAYAGHRTYLSVEAETGGDEHQRRSYLSRPIL
jgi:isoleucyl-tRNA synthetase